MYRVPGREEERNGEQLVKVTTSCLTVTSPLYTGMLCDLPKSSIALTTKGGGRTGGVVGGGGQQFS